MGARSREGGNLSRQLDLNLDAGESAASLASGLEASLYDCVTSVNVACGGHAGNEEIMRACVSLARERGLAIGAHPSFPDRENFGRRKIEIPMDELFESLSHQVRALKEICAAEGAALRHLKPHGALYNEAGSNEELAKVICRVIEQIDSSLVYVGLAGSRGLEIAKERGLATAAEAFVDRRYETDGRLRSRAFPDAMIDDADGTVEQALRLATRSEAISVAGSAIRVNFDTLCIHGDREGSLSVAQKVEKALRAQGCRLAALTSPRES